MYVLSDIIKYREDMATRHSARRGMVFVEREREREREREVAANILCWSGDWCAQKYHTVVVLCHAQYGALFLQFVKNQKCKIKNCNAYGERKKRMKKHTVDFFYDRTTNSEYQSNKRLALQVRHQN